MTRLVNLIGLFQWRLGGSEWSKGVCQCRDSSCFAWRGWGRVQVKHETQTQKIIEPSRRFYYYMAKFDIRFNGKTTWKPLPSLASDG